MAAPTVQATNVIVTKITSTSAYVNCTRGNGEGCAIWILPVRNGQDLSGTLIDNAAVNYSGQDWPQNRGSAQGGWRCIMALEDPGIMSPIQVFNLPPNTAFLVHVTECNGSPLNSPEWMDGPSENNPVQFTTDYAE